MNDDIDRLLRSLPQPDVPEGAVERLMARLPERGQVIEFRPRKRFDWRVALPLAASVLLGLYLGTTDMLSDWVYGDASVQLSASGIDDAEDAADEDLS